jgi:predicted phage terminase large subunit-like protein
MATQQEKDHLRYFTENFDFLPPHVKRTVRERLEKLMRGDSTPAARDGFLPFVRAVWPTYIHGRHHEVMSDAFERIATGKLKRCIINLPPRSTKSKFASVLFPAWYLGKYPDHKIFEGSHSTGLAMDFGRELRNLIAKEEYQQVFPHVKLAQDARAAHRWLTKQGGEYFAVGKSAGAAGRGGNLVIIDDPHSEQDVLKNASAEFEKTWNWYKTGPRQRLQPGAAILVVMTRWGVGDLTGRLIQQQSELEAEVEQWEVIELPAILPSGDSLFPEFWPIAELEATRAIMPPSRWAANYQQQPTSEQGAIIKREWWRNWPSPEPPACEYVVQAWDTAFSEKESACQSACITWGIFNRRVGDPPKVEAGVVLLDRWAGRVEFPELKKQAKLLYDQWKPDSLVVEKKATGGPLIQELFRAGIYVWEMNPSRSKDKIARTNSVADLFSSGMIWAPLGRRWVEEVREAMATFPNGSSDDIHDAAVWGLIRLRQGNLIHLGSDAEDEEYVPRGPASYY